MFTKLKSTNHPPKSKPLLAYDGNCGFCHYWVLRWKTYTCDNVECKPYASVAKNFPDIELKYFQQALRFIDTDGGIYTGPAAAFQAFRYGNKYRWVMPIYNKCRLFRFLSDHFYSFVSRNRSVMYKICVVLFGRNPVRQKPYWLYYLGGLAIVAATLLWLI